MSDSASIIDGRQDLWAACRPRDPRWPQYLPEVKDNLFLHGLRSATACEFTKATVLNAKTRRIVLLRCARACILIRPGSELLRRLARCRQANACAGLACVGQIKSLQFEFKPANYPVGPRSPNLDLLLCLDDGRRVGIESKFSEPYRTHDGFGGMSARYFASQDPLWQTVGLTRAARRRQLSTCLEVPQRAAVAQAPLGVGKRTAGADDPLVPLVRYRGRRFVNASSRDRHIS